MGDAAQCRPAYTAEGVGGGVLDRGVGGPPRCYTYSIHHIPYFYYIHTLYLHHKIPDILTCMKRYNFFLPVDLVETLKQLAQERGLKYSGLIRLILIDYVKQHGRSERPVA